VCSEEFLRWRRRKEGRRSCTHILYVRYIILLRKGRQAEQREITQEERWRVKKQTDSSETGWFHRHGRVCRFIQRLNRCLWEQPNMQRLSVRMRRDRLVRANRRMNLTADNRWQKHKYRFCWATAWNTPLCAYLCPPHGLRCSASLFLTRRRSGSDKCVVAHAVLEWVWTCLLPVLHCDVCHSREPLSPQQPPQPCSPLLLYFNNNSRG